jgi:hypothetical protein
MPPVAGGPGSRAGRGPSRERRGRSPSGHRAGSCRLPGVGHELAERDHHRRSPGWIRSRLVRVRVVVTEIGWDGEYAPPGARHRRPHRRRPLRQHHEADPAPRRTAQLQAVLPMSSTTVASVIRSRCDPAAGQTPEPSSAPRPRHLGNTVVLTADRVARPGDAPTTEQKFRRCLADYDLMAGAYETLAADDDWMFDDDALANGRAINQPATARRPGEAVTVRAWTACSRQDPAISIRRP